MRQVSSNLVAVLVVLGAFWLNEPASRTTDAFLRFALYAVVVTPLLRWWFEREVRIGIDNARRRDTDGPAGSHPIAARLGRTLGLARSRLRRTGGRA